MSTASDNSVQLESGEAEVLIAFGANLGDVSGTFARVVEALGAGLGGANELRLLAHSSLHRTEAVGGPQPEYANAVLQVATRWQPHELLDRLQALQLELGRSRSAPRHAARVVDLDVLLYGAYGCGEDVFRSERLRIPHARLEERSFVLEPLAELVPERRLRDCGLTVTRRARELRGQPLPLSLSDPDAARVWCERQRSLGYSVGFVPTMGALHEGHLSLVRRAVAENERVCVSIFVNPLQFNQASDLEAYPRDFAADAELLRSTGCSMAFTGSLQEFFPNELDEQGRLGLEFRQDAGPAATGLEGEHRPGHFDGVAAIVRRLFEVTRPDRAYFGEKDFQQLMVIRGVAERLLAETGRAPEVFGCPIVRAESGLALSSRNARLSVEEAERALCISAGLRAVSGAYKDGERSIPTLLQALRGPIEVAGLPIEYAALRNPGAWARALESETGVLPEGQTRALVAAHCGSVRLIDNLALGD